MSSIKLTTSARPNVEIASLIAIGLLALAAGVVSVRDARAAYLRIMGVETVADAEDMQRGAARDRLLEQAQERLQDALNVYPRDASLWLAMSRTRYLQATGAEVTAVSPPLLQAAADAARRAEALDPMSYEAATQLAQVLSVLPGANRTEAASALSRSYLRRGLDPVGGFGRIGAATALWSSLPQETRQSALAEACILSRQSGADATRVHAMIAPSADFANRLAGVSAQAGCAPDLSTRSPDN